MKIAHPIWGELPPRAKVNPRKTNDERRKQANTGKTTVWKTNVGEKENRDGKTTSQNITASRKKQTNKQTNKQANKQASKQTNKQTNRWQNKNQKQ